MNAKQLSDVAILIGTTPEGSCSYSASMDLATYWDGDHPWDSAHLIKELRLGKLRGYLFDSSGELMQHFESEFDIHTGSLKSAWAIHSDGTRTER